jgi:hypothetical protein
MTASASEISLADGTRGLVTIGQSHATFSSDRPRSIGCECLGLSCPSLRGFGQSITKQV